MIKIILFLTIVIFSLNDKSYASSNSEAYDAVIAAQKCYKSLPSHFQKGGTLDSMYNAKKYYRDASKYEKMGRPSMAKTYYNMAITYSGVVNQTGRAVGSKVC